MLSPSPLKVGRETVCLEQPPSPHLSPFIFITFPLRLDLQPWRHARTEYSTNKATLSSLEKLAFGLVTLQAVKGWIELEKENKLSDAYPMPVKQRHL